MLQARDKNEARISAMVLTFQRNCQKRLAKRSFLHDQRELGKVNGGRIDKEQSREFLPVKMSVTMEKMHYEEHDALWMLFMWNKDVMTWFYNIF